MERVLVTGAGGYIGTTLVPMLLAEGPPVRALDRLFFDRHLLPKHEQLQQIQADSRRLQPAWFEGLDHVIDLVAISNDPSGELFQEATYQINHESRVHCATMAKAAGVKRYILPSSCSIYGFHDSAVHSDETYKTNLLTIYAKIDGMAEHGVQPLSDNDFCVVVLRQATGYGFSPRMRYDLAITGMADGAWKTGVLPLMRDGSQWRVMVYVRDVASAQIFMLRAPKDTVNGQLFKVGSDENNNQLGSLAEVICEVLPEEVEVDWYGDTDHRSYWVNLDKIEGLGWKAKRTVRDGAFEIYEKLDARTVDRTTETITLEWYPTLTKWHQIIKQVKPHGGIVNIDLCKTVETDPTNRPSASHIVCPASAPSNPSVVAHSHGRIRHNRQKATRTSTSGRVGKSRPRYLRIAITGGSGFIGSAIIRFLLQDTEAQVVNIDKLTYAATPDALASVDTDSRYAFEKVDICDEPALRRIFARHHPDAVMHLAAESHVDRSIDSPATFIDTNITGTFTLLKVAFAYWSELEIESKRRFRFHHVSTDEVFGSLGPTGRFTEGAPYRPNSPYSASKAASDHFVRAWHYTYGLPVVTSNCSNNYGPYQFPEKLIPLTTINGLRDAPLPVYGRGQNVRDWLHVEDHARALWAILTRGRVGETYNIGGDCEMRNIEVVGLVCDILDELVPRHGGRSRRELITYVTDRPGHDLRYAVDSSKIRDQLGWRPAETFATGLRKTVAWYVENSSWWERILSTNYDGARLGLSARSGTPGGDGAGG